MFLSRTFRSRWPVLGSSAVALAAVLLTARPAGADPRIPADAKGYQVVMYKQQQLQERYRPRPVASRPSRAGEQYVSIRGTDGRLRTFRIEGQITRTYRSSASRPQRVDIRGTDGRVRTFAVEGEIIKVQPR